MSGSTCIRTLVVDDESLARERIRDMLATDPQIEIIADCGNGQEAIEAIQQSSPDLVFVDVEMPGIDGFTVIERIRSDPALRDIPAILVTSRAAPEDRQRGRDVGAQGYIVKSEFDQAELLAMIAPLME